MRTRTTKTLVTYFMHRNRKKKKAAKEKASQWDTHDRLFIYFFMRTCSTLKEITALVSADGICNS